MQLTLFEMPEETKKGEEIILTKDLRISQYMTTHIVKVNGVLYIKQQLKEKLRWPRGHRFEDSNRPFINEICEGCFKESFISELNEYRSCYKHGKPKRRNKYDK